MGKKRGNNSISVIARLQKTFPALTPAICFRKSKATSRYNCAAFAGGDTKRRWEPYYYWHPKAVRSLHFAALESHYYHECGYVHSADGKLEAGFEKLAIYADAMDDWSHAAHQRQDGWWESKLGDDVDVWHKTLDCLEGQEYGTVVRFLKRPYGQSPKSVIEANC